MSNELAKTPKPPVDIDDLLKDPSATAAPVDEEEIDQDPPDVAKEILRCKAFQAARTKNMPNAPVPSAYYFQICGEHMVFMNPTAEQYEMIVRTANNESTKSKVPRVLCTNTIFWIRGQTKPGPAGAWEHMRGVVESGGAKLLLIDRCAAAMFEQLAAAAGDDVLKKR